MSEGIVPRSRRPDHEFEIGPSTTSDAAQLEPISPELALVDPELRSEARRTLGGGGAPGVPGSHRGDARALGGDAPARAARGEGRVQGHQAPRRRPWRRRTAVVALAIVLGAAGVALASRFPPERASGTSQRQALAAKDVTQRPTTGVRTAAAAQTAAKRRSRSTKTRAAPRSRSGSSGARTPKPGRHSTTRNTERPPARPATPPTRLFVWPAVKNAAHYKVQFFRRGRLVFEAWPSAPRLELPLRWTYKGRSMRLVPGVYSWRVSPGFGPRSHARYGEPIVSSTWNAQKT
jgi:hypothetical protein